MGIAGVATDKMKYTREVRYEFVPRPGSNIIPKSEPLNDFFLQRKYERNNISKRICSLAVYEASYLRTSLCPKK